MLKTIKATMPIINGNAAMCDNCADRFFVVDSFAWLKYRSVQRICGTREL